MCEELQKRTKDMEKIIKHSGIVTAIEKKRVTVKMHVVSACQSCEAHAKCGFAEAKDKEVEIETRDWESYKIGDNVDVVIQSGNGLYAVFIAYVAPAIVLLGAFAFFYSLHLSEGAIGLLTIAAVALYGIAIFLFRSKLQQKFTFKIQK